MFNFGLKLTAELACLNYIVNIKSLSGTFAVYMDCILLKI